MNSRYRILFEVDCLHEYYRNAVCTDFDIAPSAETSALMSNAHLLSKVVENRLVVLVRVQDDGKPATVIPPDAKLVFYLQLNNPEFLTVTNLDNSGLKGRRFYFTNLNQNKSGPVFNVTKSIDAYDNAKTYFPGDFVDVGPGTTFESVKTGSGNDPSAPSPDFWISRGAVQYAWSKDLLPFLSQIANLTVDTPASVFVIKTFTLNSSNNLYDRQIREETVVLSDTETAKTVQADLRSLPPGRYRINVNGQDFDAYVDEEALANSAFGVIEIFTHLPASNAFSLLDASGVVKEMTYTVRFANRSAYWKYYTPLRKVEDILIAGAHDQPSPFVSGSNDPGAPTQKDFFVSKKPLLLSEKPADNVFDLKLGTDFSPAPKPDPTLPGMLTQTFDNVSRTYQDFFCNIHLNY